MAEPETAFAPLLATLPRGRGGLAVAEVSGLGLATVMARAGREQAVIARLGNAFGLTVEDASRRTAAGDTWVIGVGPGAWLVARRNAGPSWAEEVEAALEEDASVFDQSSGYAILRLAGAGGRALLQKGADIDLHPAAFPPGAAAVTVIAHMGVILSRPDDLSFEAAVFRSLAGSFWRWLTHAAGTAALTLHPSD